MRGELFTVRVLVDVPQHVRGQHPGRTKALRQRGRQSAVSGGRRRDGHPHVSVPAGAGSAAGGRGLAAPYENLIGLSHHGLGSFTQLLSVSLLVWEAAAREWLGLPAPHLPAQPVPLECDPLPVRDAHPVSW